MLRFLMGLSPAVAVILGLIGGGGLALGGAKLWNDWIDNPGIVRQQQAICQSEVEAAAAKATRDEQLRQFKLGEAATEQFIKESQTAADDQRAKTDVLELEIEQYEQRLSAAGRKCNLDTLDLDLLGVRNEPGSDPAGRR